MGNILAGKSALVTGAGRGIGRAIAIGLAGQGATVVVNDPGPARDGSGTDLTPAQEVVDTIKKTGGVAVANYDSVADFNSAERMVKHCINDFGKIDILVHSAGVLREKMIFNMSAEEWQLVINVHLTGCFNVSRHACVAMREQKSGRIIAVTSEAFRGTVGQCNYGAAKGGMVTLMKSIAREMGRSNVTANAVAPRAATRMTLDPGVVAGVRKRYEAGIISKEMYEEVSNPPGPEHVAPLVVYLASDQASNINGQVFLVYKGRIGLFSDMDVVKDLYAKDSFTDDDVMSLLPKTLTLGMVNQFTGQPKQ